MRVVRLLRQHGARNSSTQLQKKLNEQHNEVWLQQTAHYLTDCHTFVQASKKKLVLVTQGFEYPPTQPRSKTSLVAYSLLQECLDEAWEGHGIKNINIWHGPQD